MPENTTGGLQLQWSLDRTVHNSLVVARDFVNIATQDSVQPIALLACEHFGVTLPICSTTRSAVAEKTRPRQEPILLRFAKAVIKKAGGETLKRLSSNVAGLNFLALAAAISPAMTSAEAGLVIQRMLDKAAFDKSLVPPEHHVEAILALLEPQLNHIGFLDKFYDWDHWLRRHVAVYYDSDHQYPSPGSMEQIVSALRNLARLGDEKVDTIVFTCYSCTAWVITFVEWCLGVPPTLCSNSGSVILAQPESKVTVLLPAQHKPTEPVKLELFQSSGSLYDTLRIDLSRDLEGQPNIFSGMVNIQVHAMQTLQILNADAGIGKRGILDSLLYAIPHVISLLFPTLPKMKLLENRSAVENFRTGKDPDYWMAYLTKYFPDERRIHTTMCKYLGITIDDAKGFEQLPLGTTGM